MTKENPDDSVLDEQSEAKVNASGTEDATHAEKQQENTPAVNDGTEEEKKETTADVVDDYQNNGEEVKEPTT